MPVPGSDFSAYSYTSYGSWDGKTGTTADGRIVHDEGIFVYGIPTQRDQEKLMPRCFS